jgi:hypothetical protein
MMMIIVKRCWVVVLLLVASSLAQAQHKATSGTVHTVGTVEVLPSGPLPSTTAPGRILVDILQGSRPERYWYYEVRPGKAAVSRVKEETFRDPQHEHIAETYHKPTGAIDSCRNRPTATSPDGKYIAGCRFLMVPDGQFARKYFPTFFIAEAATSKEVFVWQMDESRDIRGFSWSPTSQSVALLDKSGVYGKSPLEILSAAAGHPVPHDNVYLHLIPLSTKQPIEFLIKSDVIYSFTRILDWSAD